MATIFGTRGSESKSFTKWPFSGRVWSSLLGHIGANGPMSTVHGAEGKNRLRRLRRHELPFLNLTEEIFNIQTRREDHALGENPWQSQAFDTAPMRRVFGNAYGAGLPHRHVCPGLGSC